MINYCFGIPTINRADLLNEALGKYVVDFPERKFFIVDNGNQSIMQHKNISAECPGYNLGVAASWNYLARKAFLSGFNGVCLLNDDVYWGKKQDQIDELMANLHGNEFVVSPNAWCLFLLTKEVFDRVGPFDERFYPAYYEDNDYHYRMKLLNVIYRHEKLFGVSVFRGSQTIARDPGLIKHSKCEAYYVEKWGGLPGKETYKTPFGK